MIEYIKMIIIALVSGFAAPLPVSSSAQFSILSKAVFLTDDENKLGFYFALFGVTLSVVIFFCLRKIYLKSFRSLFSKATDSNGKIYKKVSKNILLSVLPMAVLFIPLGEGRLLLDYFDKFLSSCFVKNVSINSESNFPIGVFHHCFEKLYVVNS